MTTKKHIYLGAFLGCIISVSAAATPFYGHNNSISAKEKQLIALGEYKPPTPSALGRFNWTEYFQQINEILSYEYAFTDYKSINWDQLYQQYDQTIAIALKYKDLPLFYETLRKYAMSINSGHVSIGTDSEEDPYTYAAAKEQIGEHIGGSYGMRIVKLDSGEYIINHVTENGPAAKAGIKLGARIFTWNNQAIQNAVAATSLLWDTTLLSFSKDKSYLQNNFVGTNAGVEHEQDRLLVRDKIGNSVAITYVNPEETLVRTANLQAVDDQWDDFLQTQYGYNDHDAIFTYKILPSGFGYIKLTQEANEAETNAAIDAAMNDLINIKHIPGLIIDVRHNPGGNDGISMHLASYFVQQNKFFRRCEMYNTETRFFYDFGDNYIRPDKLYYPGKVVVLDDLGTYCAGEGIVTALKNLPNVTVISFDANTGGSYGNLSWIHFSPGYDFAYPFGRVEDQNRNVIIEADKNGNGGIKPDIKLPMNYNNAVNFYFYDEALIYAQQYLSSIIK